jgi:serine/threonine-protein kinase
MMEYLQGETLGQRLRREGRISIAQMLVIIEQAASALGAAHAQGVVHRDLKPENIFLARDPDTGHERVKILDFGIAKLRGDRSRLRIESKGTVLGTPLYMSPEQCRGSVHDTDGRSDIYALGTVMYEMLCGRAPFDRGLGYGDVLVMHLLEPPVPPRERNPEIPDVIESVIMRTLAKEPDDRFATMAELATSLREATMVAAFAPGGMGGELTPRLSPTLMPERITPVVEVSEALLAQHRGLEVPEPPATFPAVEGPNTVVLPREPLRRWLIPLGVMAAGLIAALALWSAGNRRTLVPSTPPRPAAPTASPVPASTPVPAPPAPATAPPSPPAAPVPASRKAPAAGPAPAGGARLRSRSRKHAPAAPRAETNQPARRIPRW